jgi:hypothetical protein
MEHRVEGPYLIGHDGQSSQTLEIFLSYMDMKNLLTAVPEQILTYPPGVSFVPRLLSLDSLSAKHEDTDSTDRLLINRIQSLVCPTLISVSNYSLIKWVETVSFQRPITPSLSRVRTVISVLCSPSS